jgi:hypothetical protein
MHNAIPCSCTAYVAPTIPFDPSDPERWTAPTTGSTDAAEYEHGPWCEAAQDHLRAYSGLRERIAQAIEAHRVEMSTAQFTADWGTGIRDSFLAGLNAAARIARETP